MVPKHFIYYQELTWDSFVTFHYFDPRNPASPRPPSPPPQWGGGEVVEWLPTTQIGPKHSICSRESIWDSLGTFQPGPIALAEKVIHEMSFVCWLACYVSTYVIDIHSKQASKQTKLILWKSFFCERDRFRVMGPSPHFAPEDERWNRSACGKCAWGRFEP